MAAWRRCIAAAYAPEAIYQRFTHQCEHTFARRQRFPVSPDRASRANILLAVTTLARIVWRIGVRSKYRRTFWRLALPALRAGRIDEVIHVAVVSHHLIEFTRDCLRGAGESSFYARATVSPTPAPVWDSPHDDCVAVSRAAPANRDASAR
jgi:hopanoid C-2 methylase